MSEKRPLKAGGSVTSGGCVSPTDFLFIYGNYPSALTVLKARLCVIDAQIVAWQK